MTDSFSYLQPVCCSMSSSHCCFLTCIQISQEALGVSGNCVGYALHNILDLLGKYCLSLSQRVRAQQFASCLLDSVGFLTRHVIASKCFWASAPSWGLLFACSYCENGSVVLLGLAPAISLREGAHPSVRLSPPARGTLRVELQLL